MSSNKLLLLSFAMKFLGQDDGLCEISHRTAQPPAFASKIEVRLLFRNAVSILENSLCSFNYFPRFERSFHFECLCNEAGILERKSSLSGNRLSESDLFR